MKYSENLSYVRYLDCKAKGDIPGAKQALEACLHEDAFRNNPIQHADLLQRMGDLCQEAGSRHEAIRYHELAEKADPSSLLVKYYFAKFMAEKLNDNAAAIAKCDQIIALAQREPFPESDDDFGSATYIEKAEKLRRSLALPD